MKNLNILIIDDDDFQRHILKQQLSKVIKCDVETACNGSEGLMKASEHAHIDVIFTDINMPDFDGVKFLRELSKLERDIPIVLFSAESNDIIDSVKTMAKYYGFSSVHTFKKPIAVYELNNYFNHSYSPITAPTSTKETHFTADQIALAFKNKEFIAHFQAHINVKGLHIEGVESLVRWNHPTLGLLSPFHFLPAVEESGLLNELTNHMLETSIAACARWHKLGKKIGVSVNITHQDLQSTEFVNNVEELMLKYQLKPDFLTLELTETQIAQDLALSLDSLNRLRLKRFKISIDDFGTGHSSLMQLIDIPCNELKIDMSFVKTIFTNYKSLAAVKASIMLAKSIGLKTIAEGVETSEHARILKELGCDTYQGYYFAKPMTDHDFEDLLFDKQQNTL